MSLSPPARRSACGTGLPLAPYCMTHMLSLLLILGREPGCSTSRSTSTRLAQWICTTCSSCAALLPATRPPQSAVAPSPARLPPPGPYIVRPAPSRVPCLRPSAGGLVLQPAAELGHLQRHEHVRHVLRALLPALCPDICSSSPCPAARRVHTALARRHPPAPPGPQLAPHRVPCFCAPLGRPRRTSTRTSPAGTPPASRTCARCLTGCCSPRAAPQYAVAPFPLHAACTAVARRLPPPGCTRPGP